MLEKEQKFKLSDLIDMKFLQEFQDVFAKTANVASITVDDSGSITKPSNFTDFCIKYTRGSVLGLKKCVECDIRWGKLAAVRGEPVIYDCHTGLTDFAVPIVVDGKHIASILGGQVLTKTPNEENFREIARQLGIDEDEYIQAVRKIKIVPMETVKAAAHLLFLVANAISDIGHKSLLLKQKNRRESLYRNVMETIRSTLDIEETKSQIVEIIGKSLHADRCFIMEYDKENEKFFIIKDEYLSSCEVVSYKGTDVNLDVPNFVAAIKKGKNVIINNKDICMGMNTKEFDKEKEAIERLNVTGAFAFPLYYFNDFLGAVALHYSDPGHCVSEEDINFLEIIANQIAIAIHQANLYQATLVRTEREGLYRTILETVRGSIDIEKTKKQILEVVCKALNADRCFIVDFDKDSDKFLAIKDEYLSSDDIVEMKGVDLNIEIPNFVKAAKMGKKLIIDSKEINFATGHKNFDLEKIAIEKYGVNSALGFPLYYSDELLGVLSIHYIKSPYKICDDDINLLDNISNQISLAIHESNLYNMLKQKSEDQKAILNNIPFMAWLKDNKSRLLAVNEEFAKMCSETVENVVGKTDFDFFSKEHAESYVLEDRQVMETKQTLLSEDLIVGPEGESWHETFKSPVFDKQGNIIGTVGLARDITERKEIEIELLRRQEMLIKAAEREKLIREIIEKIRSTLDIDELFELICTELLEIYDVQRSFIVEYRLLGDHNEFYIRKELKSSPEVKGLQDEGFDSRTIDYWGTILLREGQKIVIDNIAESDMPDFFKETYKNVGAKSIMGIAVKKGEDSWGWVGVSEYNYCRHWNEGEVSLLESISGQIHIAIKQAELYKITQQDAQREVILRKTIEVIRSSMDVNSVKREMVIQIGAFLQADRVAFADYDFKKENYSIYTGNEYRSSEEVKTFVGYDFAATPGFIEAIRELHLGGKDIIFSDLDKYLEENNLKGTGVENFYREMGFNSSIAINIFYGENFYGDLVVTFEQKREITENDVKFIKTLADQAGIAIYQFSLYKKEKEATERERLIGAIVSKAISTFDINQIKQIVKEIGIITGADRCYFVEVDLENMKGKPIDFDGEYLASDDIKSIIGYNFSPKDVKKFVELYLNARDLVVFDYEKICQDKSSEYEGVNRYSSQFDLKTGIGIPFIHNDKLTAVIVIEYVKEKVLPTEDELNFLRILANQTGMAFEQIQLYQETKKIAERESLLRNITEKTISSLDIDEILSFICEETAKLFSVQRVAISVLPESGNYKNIVIRKEYRSDSSIKSFEEMKLPEETLAHWGYNLIEEGKSLAFDNLEESDTPEEIKNPYVLFGVKSIMGTGIKKGKNIWGTLVISEYSHYRHWSEDEKTLLAAIASQVYIAINQAELFEKEKLAAEREKFLRQLMMSATEAKTLEEVLKTIVTKTGEFLTVDRCFFVEYDFDKKAFLPAMSYGEYNSSEDIRKMSERSFTQEESDAFAEMAIHRRKSWVVNNIYEAEMSDAARLVLEQYSIKSFALFPVYYQDNPLGMIAINSVKEFRTFRPEEIDVMSIVAIQAAAAMYQKILYNRAQKTAEKEKALRDVMLSSVSTFDLKDALMSIVTKAGELLKADRCFFVEIEQKTSSNLQIEDYVEYLSSPNIQSHTTRFINKEETEVFINSTLQKRLVFTDDVTKEDLPEPTRKMLIDDLSVKSYLNVPVYHADIIYGSIVFHYVNENKHFTQDDIDVAQAIANQSAIVIHKAKLFEITQIQAEREKLLRKTFETVRSSLDINNVKTGIVTEVCKALGADRCFIIEYDKQREEFLVISDEYLASEDIPSYKGANVNVDVPSFAATLKKGENIIINNREIYHDPDPQKIDAEKELLERFNINSAFAFPLYYSDELLGAMSIHYVNREHIIQSDEINLLNIIANQISIAMHQAKLYKITQVQAEREKISRNIVEILRSSLDKKTIKRLFVKNIGKYFDADRVFFSDYDMKQKTYSPVDEYSEYLSGSDVKSFVGYDWSCDEAREFIKPLLEKRELKIPDWYQYLKENPKGQDFVALFEDAKVKSSYNFPVMYQDRIMGYFAVEFTHSINRLSDEDVNRIRSMCTQSAIALYQAELYQKVQESNRVKGEFITNISNSFREPLNNIIEFSAILPKAQVDCEKQTEYLNTINETGKKLLNFTNYIARISEQEASGEDN